MNAIKIELFGKSGIYMIVNNVNGKKYIGSSVNIYNRLHAHLKLLKENRSHNKHLLAAWNKYGTDSFTYSILEYCDKQKRFDREQYYIDTLKPEYNFSLQVMANINRVLTTEEKLKISNTLKEKYKKGEIAIQRHESTWRNSYIYNINNLTFCGYTNCMRDALRAIYNTYDVKNTHPINYVYKRTYFVTDIKFTNTNDLYNYIYQNLKLFKSSNGRKYLVTELDDGRLFYHRDIKECALFNNITLRALQHHYNATRELPYIPKNTTNKIYFTREYVAVNHLTASIEISNELKSGEFGERLYFEDPEINLN